MKIYKKAILPKGFKAGGVSCGIKKSGKLDLALFYCKSPAIAVCRSTTNKIQAAPIKINNKYLERNEGYHAIIVNSGNANAFTGELGIKDAEEMTRVTANALGVKKESVLVASTGIIGRKLPIEKIKEAVPDLVKGISEKGVDKAQRAIMTTDTFAKKITVRFNIGNRVVNICGIAKGAGMIAPHIATMLVFILTDADIAQGALNHALGIAVENSFNCITVDGCMSTNDTVIILANRASGNERIDMHTHFPLFLKALNSVCLELAKMIVKDGEGATKFIRIKINEAKNYNEAKNIALAIANSNLFKAAMFASSSNIIGRIVASVGAAGIDIKENNLKIKFTPLKRKEVDIDVSIGRGRSNAVIYTSDLTYEYVKINAEYN